MSINKNIVIIGPSKVGKTALVASLYHAAVTLNQRISQEEYTIEVIPKNSETTELFTQVNSLLQTGAMPFAGSYEIRNYHLQMTAPDPAPTFFERMKEMLGMDEEDVCDIHFPDAPGGAIFHGDDEESDEATIKKLRSQLIGKLSNAYGLIICLDASILSPNVDTNDQRRTSLNFAKWLPGLLAEVLEKQGKNDTGRLNIQRVCIVMTKSDLWAKNNGYTDLAETTVQNRNGYDHAVDILGKAFFTGLRQFFDKDTEFSFFMSSVYGFYQGGLQTNFFEEMDEDEVVTLDEWTPFNVIEPFLTAVDATPPNTFVVTKKKQEVGV